MILKLMLAIGVKQTTANHMFFLSTSIVCHDLMKTWHSYVTQHRSNYNRLQHHKKRLQSATEKTTRERERERPQITVPVTVPKLQM